MADVNVNFPPAPSPVRGVSAIDMEAAITQVKADVEGQISGVTGQISGAKGKIDDLWLDVKKDFGAKGDWNDATGTGTDDSDAIQAAFDAVRYETGSQIKLYFPKGRYRITKPIIGHRMSIYAEGNVLIYCDGANAYLDFKPINPQTLNEFYELFINKISFKGRNGAVRAIKISNGSQFYLEKIYAYEFTGAAIELIGCTISNLIRPTVSNGNVAVLLNGCASISFMHGDFYGNQADFKFVGFNSGIKVFDNWFEDSKNSFLFDNTVERSNVGGLYITQNMFGRNDPPSGPIFKIIGTGTAMPVSVINGVFHDNRTSFKMVGIQNLLGDFDFTGGNANSVVQLSITDNYLYNENNPDGYAIKAIGNAAAQLQIVYEDNITSGAVNIVDGSAQIAGIDRSGTALTRYNKVRGELLLEQPASSINMNGALSWDNTNKLPRFSDGVGYKSIQGISSGTTANRPVSPIAGYVYFDTSINRPMSWNGSFWRTPMGGNDYKFNRATILAGTTSIVVTHGLSLTPTDVLCTAYGDVGNVWVSNITSTQFTINCKTAPVANTVVSYQVQA